MNVMTVDGYSARIEYDPGGCPGRLSSNVRPHIRGTVLQSGWAEFVLDANPFPRAGYRTRVLGPLANLHGPALGSPKLIIVMDCPEREHR
jgi:hypothetical protein